MCTAIQRSHREICLSAPVRTHAIRPLVTRVALLGRDIFTILLTSTLYFYQDIYSTTPLALSFSVMANPTQAPNPVEPLPRTLQDWLARDDASARFNKGDAYIATRTWKCDQDVQTVKVFGDQTIDDVAQRQIGDFPNRDSGVWHADPNLRKARWSKSCLGHQLTYSRDSGSDRNRRRASRLDPCCLRAHWVSCRHCCGWLTGQTS